MIYHEENLNLFLVDRSYCLAHCISADFALGAGIAKEFDKRFNLRSKLFKQFPNGFYGYLDRYNILGECIFIQPDNIFNLVTKRNYYDKPTYESMKQALNMMSHIIQAFNINKIAMPTIGCGLDKLEWPKVRDIIIDKFNRYDNLEILVCKYDK